VNILLNQVETNIAGVTALRTKAEVLNLGKSFHYQRYAENPCVSTRG
jgi:hypothetical protein